MVQRDSERAHFPATSTTQHHQQTMILAEANATSVLAVAAVGVAEMVFLFEEQRA